MSDTTLAPETVFGERNAQQIEHSRHQVDRPDRIADAPSFQLVERRPDDEGHMGGRLVDEEPVRGLAVIVEALAVIAHHRDDRPVEQALRAPESSITRAELRIGERDLALVQPAGIPSPVRLGRIVRAVRVVEVQPREEALSFDFLEPRQRPIDDLVGRTLHGAREAADLPRVEIVDVGGETVVDAPLVIEHVHCDDGARVEPRILQDGRERRLFRRQEEAPVVTHAVLGGESPGEDAAVRRQRQRRHGLGLIEQHTFSGEPVEGGRGCVSGAVGTEMIGARGVEGDDDEIQGGAIDAARKGPEFDAAGRVLGLLSANPCPCAGSGNHEGSHGDPRDRARAAERKL